MLISLAVQATREITKNQQQTRKMFLYGLLIILLVLHVHGKRSTANPNASEEASQLLEFLFDLRGSKKVLLGQNLGHGNGILGLYSDYVEKLNEVVGKRIGFIGGDYGLDPNQNTAALSELFVGFSNSGGIIMLSWYVNNPWTGGSSWETNMNEDLWELLDTSKCNDACQAYGQYKSKLAEDLGPLRDANVPVLFRPFHEMNGNWLWWSQKTWEGHEEAFIALWRDLFNYLITEKSMNNLLWVYSVGGTWEQTLTNYFPGLDYVDVVGVNIFDDNAATPFVKRDYDDLKSLGDFPMGLTTFGPTLETAYGGQYDYRRLLQSLDSNWPDFCFSFSWNNWEDEEGKEFKLNFSSNQFLWETFVSPNIVTLEEIRRGIKPRYDTSNLRATDATRRLFFYLISLKDENKVLIGQNLGYRSQIVQGYDSYVIKLQSQTGKWPGMIGGDYGLGSDSDIASTSRIFIDYYKNGGIITLSWAMENPWTDKGPWDTTKNENLSELTNYKQCNAACQTWSKAKLQIAQALRPLKDADVPVLWRPFCDMNAEWYWWGHKSVKDHRKSFIALWKDLYHFLTFRMGFSNLLWVYSVASTQDALISEYYPGPEFVDVVGINIFDQSVNSYFSERDYNLLKSLGNHPMGLTEFAPLSNGQYDYSQIINKLESTWSDFSFALIWNNYDENGSEVKNALVSNQKSKELLSSAKVITLDEVKMNSSIEPWPIAPRPIAPRPIAPQATSVSE
jgi:beta-mannanase